MRALICPIVFLAATCMAHSQSVVLRYKFVPGATRVYKESTREDMKIDAGKGKVTRTKTATTEDIKYTVKSVETDGTGTLAWTFRKIMHSVNGRPLHSDTRTTHKTERMSPLGRVLYMNNPGSSATGLGGNPEDRPQVDADMPEGPVHIGSTWDAEVNYRGTTLSFKNTLEQITTVHGHRIATIRMTGTIDVADALAALYKDGLPGGLQASGTVALTLHVGFDVDDGVERTESGVLYTRMKMTGFGPGGQPISISTSGTSTTSRLLISG